MSLDNLGNAYDIGTSRVQVPLNLVNQSVFERFLRGQHCALPQVFAYLRRILPRCEGDGTSHVLDVILLSLRFLLHLNFSKVRACCEAMKS